MILAVYGFIFGCLIPYFARKIGKLCSFTMGYVLLKLFIPTHYMPWKKLKNNPKYTELLIRYIMRSIGWGIFSAAASYIFCTCFNPSHQYFYIAFLWMLLLLIEIDKRFMLLPDVLTVPLLVIGFLYAANGGVWLASENLPMLSLAQNSALGAICGYLMPVIASMAIVWKYPDAFGGGDIKLLCVIGAWVGAENIPYILLGSCIFFVFSCLINRSKIGPFGPSIIYATLLFCVLMLGN